MENKTPIIALVDDDKVFQITASRTIKAAQLTDKILQFENAEDALHFLKDHARDSETLPDYIFLDINMPYIDGWMFLDESRNASRKWCDSRDCGNRERVRKHLALKRASGS